MLLGLSLALVCIGWFVSFVFLQNYCSWIVSADEVVIAFWFLMVGLGGLFWLGPGCLVLQLLADCVYVVQLLMKRKPYSSKKKKIKMEF